MTTNLTTQCFAVTSNWLEGTTTTTHYSPTSSVTATWTPVSNYWWYYPVHEHRPIKLGLSEVEKLRSAAKRDAKLKKILEKFTDQIEVVVDFK